MSRRIIALVAFACMAGAAFAQQITRVAVVDMQKVYLTYFKDSQAVRAFEEDKQRVQDEIARIQAEIQAMQARRLELQRANDAEGLRLLDDNLRRRALYLQDYIRVKQAELDAKALALTQSNSFAQALYRAVQATAELEGFSLVLSSRNLDSMGPSVIWFSPMVDLTDKVIQTLVSGL